MLQILSHGLAGLHKPVYPIGCRLSQYFYPWEWWRDALYSSPNVRPTVKLTLFYFIARYFTDRLSGRIYSFRGDGGLSIMNSSGFLYFLIHCIYAEHTKLDFELGIYFDCDISQVLWTNSKTVLVAIQNIQTTVGYYTGRCKHWMKIQWKYSSVLNYVKLC